MNRTSFTLNVALLTLTLSLSHRALAADEAPDASNPPQKYYVTGRVLDKESHVPIADAKVQILDASQQDLNRRLLSTTTDSSGSYRIEAPLGSSQLWYSPLKPGYWLEQQDEVIPVVTTAEQPIVTRDILARPGTTWPIEIAVENGVPPDAAFAVYLVQIENDAVRKALLDPSGVVSFDAPVNRSRTTLQTDGSGSMTLTGKDGKYVVTVAYNVAGSAGDSLNAEFIVDPNFNRAEIKSIENIPAEGKTVLTDSAGRRATIGQATVTLKNGLPLLRFKLEPWKAPDFQQFSGRIVDQQGQPVAAVRVGSTVGNAANETDADGRFVINQEVVESVGSYTFSLVVTKNGYAAFDSHAIEVPRTATTAIDVGQFTLQPGYSLPVRVGDANGQLLAGADVEPFESYALRRQITRTGPDGRCTLRNLPAGLVRVSLSYGNSSMSSKLVVSPNVKENIEVTLGLNVPADARRNAETAAGTEKKTRTSLAVGADAPDWSVDTWTDDQQRSLKDYRGRIVVLDFWGAWCSPCINAIPALQQLAEEYEPRGVVFLSIHTPGTEEHQIEKLKKLKGWTAPTAIDRGSQLASGETAVSYQIRGYPTTFIIGPTGKVAFATDVDPRNEQYAKQLQAIAAELHIELPSSTAKLTPAQEEQVIQGLNKLLHAVLSRQLEAALAAQDK